MKNKKEFMSKEEAGKNKVKLCLLILGIFTAPLLTGCNLLQKHVARLAGPPVLMNSKPLIIIMAGQSNITGGYFEDRITPDTTRIEYVYPAGSGPIVPFAQALVGKHPALNVIIISCGKSGTYLSQWMPGGLIEACITAAKAQEPNGIVSGFVFLQGEADTKENGPLTYDWAASFTSLARYVRSHFQSEVPIVLCRINKTTLPGFPLWDHIRQEQDSVTLPNLAHISTDGAGLIDGIHYDQPGYAMVGQRMADAMYGLLIDGQ